MESCDCLVLGAGVIGCAVAWRLRQTGLSVSVIDRGAPGAEASSAAGGILAPQVEAHGPGPLFTLLRESRLRFPAWAEELRARTGIDVGYRTDGTVALAFDEHEVEELRARVAWQAAAGLAVEPLEAGALRAREPHLAPALSAARFPDDHQVDTRPFVEAIAQAAARAGVRFLRGQVRRVLTDGTRALGADVDGARLSAGHVVIAGGAWSSLVDGCGLSPSAVVPVRGQVIEVRARPPLFDHVVFADGGYLVPRADGRVLCGSTEERVGFVKEVTPAGLERLGARIARVCPALADAPPEPPWPRSWAGLRPGTRDGLPYLGSTPLAGLTLATGHYRNGILLTPITAASVTAIVTGAPPPLDLQPFSPMRHA